MEQHLEDLARVQSKKHAVASRRAMEFDALRPTQGEQGLAPMKEGKMISGGEAGLRRVVGSGMGSRAGAGVTGGSKEAMAMCQKLYEEGEMTADAHKKMMAMLRKRKVGDMTKLTGGFWGALASLAMPLIGKLLGQGKMTQKAHDAMKSVMGSGPAGGAVTGGAYTDSQFGVINEPYSSQTEGSGMCGGAMYGKMLKAHLMKTKGGAFVKDFMSGMSEEEACKAQRAKNPYTKQVLPCEAKLRSKPVGSLRDTFEAMKNPKPMGVGLKGKGAPAGAGVTGGKRTLPPALRRRADAMKRLIREEGMTFKEAIAYLKQHPPQ